MSFSKLTQCFPLSKKSQCVLRRQCLPSSSLRKTNINSRIFLGLELNPFSPATQVSFTEMSIRGTTLILGLSVFNLLPVRRAIFLSITRLKQTAGHELFSGVPAGSLMYEEKPLQKVWSGSPHHLQIRLRLHFERRYIYNVFSIISSVVLHLKVSVGWWGKH